ncbi:DMT family transporter [Zwartia panacis]|uniref:DMT family transporter n=1 Tax=Zwartia panacis TaxID=2683345 RepID=UPI0025B4D67B|nr:DMT family transporter [Zwartia panacis]MDN4016831.1 DMT family transporter [Zwartia panacis]
MSTSRKSLDATAYLSIIMLCTLWGGQQILFKLSIDDISPSMQIALRSSLGCLLLALFMWQQGESLALWKGPWRAGMSVGLIFGLEWWMIGESLRLTTASHLVVFLYTAPIFTALGLHIWVPEEHLSRRQWAGVFVSFIGIGIGFIGGANQPHFDLRMLWGDLLALGAGLGWAITTVLIRTTGLAKLPATQTTFYQLFFAALALLLACVLTDQYGVRWSQFLVISIISQGVFIAFLSLLVWFWLLKHYLASRVSIFTFLTPLLGVTFGVLILDEPLHAEFVWGALLVMVGVIMVNWPSKVAAIAERVKTV